MITEPSDYPFTDKRTNIINSFFTELWFSNPLVFLVFINEVTEEMLFKRALTCQGACECRQKLSSKQTIKTLYFSNSKFNLFVIADKKRIMNKTALYDYISFFVNNLNNGCPRILIFISDKYYDETNENIQNIKSKITKDESCYEVYLIRWSHFLKIRKKYMIWTQH